MYICNCNGLTERQVEEAIAAGAKKWRDVHAFHGCSPQCGGCGVEIADYISPTSPQDFACGTPAIFAEA